MRKLSIAVGTLLVAVAGCGSDAPPKQDPPTITTFTPTSGPVGTHVQIVGTGFSTKGFNVVKFNGTEGQVAGSTATLLSAIVPVGATTGRITVTNPGGTAMSAEDFTVKTGPIAPPTKPPTITSFTPMNGPVGTKVTIIGTDFAETGLTDNTVTIGGVLAPVSAATATQLQVNVPQGAVTGPIRVATVAGSYTTKASFTVSKIPAAPANLTAIAVSSTQINLSWGLSDGATGYNIYRTTTPGVTATAANKLPASPVSAPPHPDTGLTTGTTYYYVVTATNANGESAPSKEVSAIPTLPPPAPPTITGFAPTNGTVGTTVVVNGTNFSPLAPNNTVKFNGVASVVSTATAASLSATVPAGATTGTITVTTAAGTAQSATPFTVLLPPPAPANVTAIAVTSTQVNLSWGLVSTASAYNIYRGTSPGVVVSAANKLTATPVGGPPYADTGLTTGTWYYYIVTAVNSNGESLASKEVGAVPSAPPPLPPTINGFSPTNGIVGSAVTITGTNFSSIATNNTVAFNGVAAVVNSASTTSFTVTVPAGATTGYISVTTAAGTTKTATFFTVLSPPDVPSNPTATAASSTQVNINWGPANKATGYNVYRAVLPGVTLIAGNKITATPVAAPPFNDTGLTTGTQYFYVVTSVNANGESGPSKEVSAVPTTPPPAPPTITGFTPTNGPVGTVVTITGTNFATAATNNTVAFNGVPGVVSAASATQLTATVPAGATTGYITVTTAAGAAKSAGQFSVLGTSPPTISGFAPTNGTVGTTVTISGSNFSTQVTANTVTFNNVVAVVTAATATQLTVTVPVSATTGYIKVTTSAGSAQSATQFTVLVPPATPTNLTAVPVSSTQVNLAWTTVTGATGYNIYWDDTPGVTPATGTKVPATPPPYSHTGLTPNTTYYYVVTAVNANGESAASKEAAAKPTTPPPAPPTITDFAPTSGTVGTSVTINGTNFAPDPINNTVTFNGVPAAVDLSSTPVKLVVTVPGGATSGSIKVITATGTATSASPFTVTASAPVAPGGVAAVPGVGQITISWSPVSGASSYNIYFAPGATPVVPPSGNPTPPTVKLANVTSPYTHNNLTTSLTYNYVVTAVNTAGESVPSTVVSATPAIPIIVARLVSGIPQTILQSNIEVSVKDNLGAPITNAVVVLNSTTLAYDTTKKWYKGYNNVLASGVVNFSVTINGSTYSLPSGITEFSTYPNTTEPLDGAIDPPPITVKWDAGAPTTGSYNYGIIVFDTVSINPYWENFLYWNNFISPALANPGVGSTVPSLPSNSGNVALFVYINKTETVTLDGVAGGVSVGSIDIIGSSVAHTIVTIGCSQTSCPTGCCFGNNCQSGTTDLLCGMSGGGCTNCTTNGRTCVSQTCICTGATNCWTGSSCVTSADSSCGSNGGTCVNCTTTGKTCSSGTCVCNGCMSGTSCQPGTANDKCGTGGATCIACITGQTCVAGQCVGP